LPANAPFDLSRNPFHILGARLDATAEEIVDLCQEGVFEGRFDEATAAQAQQVLIPPRSRLEAEIGWYADAPPEASAEIAKFVIEGAFGEALAAAQGAAPLARANAAAHLCGRFLNNSEALSLLIDAWNGIDRDRVFKILEASRKRARSPRPDREHFDEALRKLQGLHARQAVVSLQASSRAGTALTGLVEKAIGAGALGPMLSAIVRDYDRSTEQQLASVRELIEAEVKRARITPWEVDRAVKRLGELLHDWDAINQPVQLLEQQAGHEEPRSRELCAELRGLAIWLANDKLKHREALTLTKALLHTFPELESVAAQLRKDQTILEDIVRRLPPPPKPKPQPRPATRVASAPPHNSHDGAWSSDSKSVSGWRWFLAVIGAVAFFAMLNSNTTPPRPVAQRPPPPLVPAAAPVPRAEPAAPAPAQEVVPPANATRALTTAELRYCEFQDARLEHLRPLLSRTQGDEVTRFNRLVDDWNARCGRFTYRPSQLASVRSERRRQDAELRRQAAEIVAGWRQGVPAPIPPVTAQPTPMLPRPSLPASPPVVVQQPLLSLSTRADALRIQEALRQQGLYRGAIDGLFGPQSRRALREYQRLRSLPGDGSWNIETQRALLGQ